jgi:hypothetical protein
VKGIAVHVSSNRRARLRPPHSVLSAVLFGVAVPAGLYYLLSAAGVTGSPLMADGAMPTRWSSSPSS